MSESDVTDDQPWLLPEAPLFSVRICINKRLNTDNLPNCAGRGSRALADEIERRLLRQRIPAGILRGPCMNNCQIGPNLKIPDSPLISLNGDISEARIEEIMVAIRAAVAKRKASATP